MKTTDKVLEYVIKYMKEHQYSPSVNDISKEFGFQSNNTSHYHLVRLAMAGKIDYDGRRMITVKGYRFGKDSRYDN